MKKLSPILYNPSRNEFSVILKEAYSENMLTYGISFIEQNKFNIYEYENEKLMCSHMNTSENDPLVKRFKQTLDFQRIEHTIHSFEEKMKRQLQIENATFEGKDEKNRFILSCDVISPLFNDDLTFYPIEELNAGSFDVIKKNKIHIRFNKDKQQYTNIKSDFHKHYTHRTFVQDITELIVKDPRVRVRMLVN